jgi:hypothetical protein
MTDATSKTEAIIVGVESYTVGANWNLDGPASDACRFARWLLAKGVPSERITLLVSPLPENRPLLDDLGLPYQPAEHAAITRALIDDLSQKSGDLLVFFWSGHGAIDARNSRRLFCSDATAANLRHLSLNSLLASWRTNTIGHFPRQIGFVDACQNYIEYSRLASTIPEDTLPSGTPVSGVEQFFLLAASVGELAANLTSRKAGAFSLALMEELVKSGTDWPPDVTDLNQQLMERFTILRDMGRAEQTPSHFWYRDWNGSEGTIASHQQRMPSKPGSAIQLTNEERDQVVLALLELEIMSNTTERDSLIADLRREIKHNTARSPKARFDVDNLVKTALKYNGGLKELIHVVKRFEGAETDGWRNLETVLASLKIAIN